MAIRGHASGARESFVYKNPVSHVDFTAFEAAVFEADLLLTLSPSSSEVVLALLRIGARGLRNPRVFVSSVVALT
jgi:hypothetical protein